MGLKTLAQEEIGKLFREETIAVDKRAKALNPLQKIDLRDAVKQGATEAKIQSRWFYIKYVGTKIWYEPVQGYVPCGWVEKEKVLSEVYIS